MDISDIVAAARTHMGTPWVHQGRTRDGVDCLGVVTQVARATHGSTVDLTNYTAQAMDETMLDMCAQHLDPVAAGDWQPGDVVVMRFENNRHMGILGDYRGGEGLSVIHASSTRGQVVEHRLDSVWRRRCLGAFRFREAA